MKYILLFFSISSFCCSSELSLEDLNKLAVIGPLKIPVGEVVKIHGRIGAEKDNKEWWAKGEIFIIVDKVGGSLVDGLPIRLDDYNPNSTEVFKFIAGENVTLIGYQAIKYSGRPIDAIKLFKFENSSSGQNYSAHCIFIPLKADK